MLQAQVVDHCTLNILTVVNPDGCYETHVFSKVIIVPRSGIVQGETKAK